MRAAQSIGLHRHLPHLNLSPAEVEQRRNIFWVGLVTERQINLRMGRPSTIHDDDIGVYVVPPSATLFFQTKQQVFLDPTS